MLQRQQDAAHRRHLTAVKTLATVNKLLPPTPAPVEIATRRGAGAWQGGGMSWRLSGPCLCRTDGEPSAGLARCRWPRAGTPPTKRPVRASPTCRARQRARPPVSKRRQERGTV
jgi:hypothetical protein